MRNKIENIRRVLVSFPGFFISERQVFLPTIRTQRQHRGINMVDINTVIVWSGVSMALPSHTQPPEPTSNPGIYDGGIAPYDYERPVTGPSVTIINTSVPSIARLKCIYDDGNIVKNPNYEIFIFVLFVPVLSVIAFCGLITNTLSYIVLRREGARGGRTPDLILRVLSVADNFVLVTYVLFYTFPHIFVFTRRFVEYYEWFMYAKRYIWFALWVSKTFSVYTVVLLTIDRYVAVCKPLRATSFCTKRNAMLGIAFVCAFSVAYNIPKIWYVKTAYKLDPCTNLTKPYVNNTMLMNNKYFTLIYVNILYLLIMFFVPLTLLVILNIFLVRAVRKARRIQSRLTSQGRESRDNVTERVIAVVTTFIILESPAVILNTIVFYSSYLSPSSSLKHNLNLVYAMRATYILSAINSCVNFYIYCLVGKRFRKLVLKIVCPKTLKSDWLPMTSHTRSSLMTHYQPAKSPHNSV
ncbi:FMRFamide receptor-like [Tubulanus polymorphus]|uniref:FMRFamide receptor-like n=1 Tax=Tubulanus polymorphus TaxID=672921 RepID=UPI003DA26551